MPNPNSAPAAVYRGVLLDLDGTIVDHFDTLYRCYRETFEHLGLDPPDGPTVRRSVGGSMEITMSKLVAQPELREKAASWWRQHFTAIYLDDVKPMPGALWMLRELAARGLILGVLTNKIGEQSRGICTHLGFDPYLKFVIGANDTGYRKPQREFSELALMRLGVAAEEAVLVGDSPYDIEAARHLGIHAPCVTTGTHSAEELRAAGADAIYEDLYTLGEAVFGLKTP